MKKRGAVGTYLILVVAILLSKVLGMVRNILLASAYGASAMTDAFNAATSLPLNLFDITLSAAIVSAFVPVFNEKLTLTSKEEAERFGSNFLNVVALIAGTIAALGMIFPRVALKIVASALSEEALVYAVPLTRMIMPVVFLAAALYVFIGILQSYGQFTGPALVSLVSNVAMVVYFLFFNQRFGIYGLGVAFTFGWLCQLLFLFPFLYKKKFHYSFTLQLRSPDLRRVLMLTLPLFVAALAQPINQLITSNISSGVGKGILSSVQYAYQAYFIVSGIFSYCLTNLFFPEMSRCFARNDIDAAKGICSSMLGSVSAIVIPIMAFMIGNSNSIIRLLYQRGSFTHEDTERVGSLLMIYCCAMLFYSYQEILNKYFYSMQKVKLPVITAFLGIAVNLTVALLTVGPLGVYGLALGTLSAAGVMAVLLLAFTAKATPGVLNRPLLFGVLRDIVGAMALFVAAREVRIWVEDRWSGALGTAAGLGAGLAVGLVAYLLILWLTGSKELRALAETVKKKKEKA